MAAEDGQSGTTEDPCEWEGLDPRKALFVQCLMDGDSINDAAEKVGNAPRTLRTWRREPAVQAALRTLMSEAMNRARIVLTANAVHASVGLVEVATGAGGAGDGPRVQACNAILDRMVSLAQFEELEARIAAIEAKLLSSGDVEDGQGQPQ